MELRHLRYFVAVAEHLHFGKAAKQLGIVQPALSRQIRDLEHEIGAPLFDRDRRRVELTVAGAAYLVEARIILSRVAEATDVARRTHRGELGRLRIGYVPSVAHTRLPLIVREFRRACPGVAVRLSEMRPTNQVQALLADRLDIGFARGPLREPGLAQRTVLVEPLVVAVSRRHPLANRTVLSMRDLRASDFILPARESGPGAHDQILSLCHVAGFTPTVVHEGSLLDVMACVGAGLGVAVVPGCMRGERIDGVVLRELKERATTSIVMAWKEGPASPVVERFVRAAEL